MDTKSFVMGYAVGYNDGLDNSSGEPSEEWQPPADWLEVPEPNNYEIYFLVEIVGMGSSGIYGREYEKINIGVARPKDANTGWGALSVDWGDGILETYAGYENGESWSNLNHSYDDMGQYLIKITTTEQSCFLQSITERLSLLIVKLGDKIIVNNNEASGQTYYGQNAFREHERLHWVQLNGAGGLPNANAFQSCYALKRVDIKIPPKIIPQQTFSNCYCLKKFDFSEVETIGNYALQSSGLKKLELPKCTSIDNYGAANCYSLDEVYAPLCLSVGASGLYQCYELSKVQFAETCTFGTNCFQNCYSLYPRPDKSIN